MAWQYAFFWHRRYHPSPFLLPPLLDSPYRKRKRIMETRHHEEAIHPYTCQHGTKPTVISILFWVSPEVPMQKKSSQLTVSSLENTIQMPIQVRIQRKSFKRSIVHM